MNLYFLLCYIISFQNSANFLIILIFNLFIFSFVIYDNFYIYLASYANIFIYSYNYLYNIVVKDDTSK